MKEKLQGKHFILGFQHLFAMFGATVLVPALTNMNPAIALLAAGLGTLIFHFCTKGKVPVFLGSSFAYIAALIAIIGGDPANIPKAQGAIIIAGLVYLALSVIVYFVGADKIRRLFPPIVTGPVIMVIGLNLSPTAITNASECWPLAIIVLVSIVAIMCFTKGFFKMVPILTGIVIGYAVALISDLTGLTALCGFGGEAGRLIDFSVVEKASWFIDFKQFHLPVFDISAISILAPVAFVTFMEHIGDITTNGAVVGQDFFKDPGMHRTLLGDGIATSVAGLIGAPPNTTYGENTGVLAVTKVYDPRILRIAACYAIVLGLIGKFGAVLQTLPTALMGGVSFILFGMIAAIGMRTLTEAKLDFSHSRNLLITGIILVLGLGLGNVSMKWIFDLFGAGGSEVANTLSLSGLFLATLVGVLLNLILPKEETKEPKKEKIKKNK